MRSGAIRTRLVSIVLLVLSGVGGGAVAGDMEPRLVTNANKCLSAKMAALFPGARETTRATAFFLAEVDIAEAATIIAGVLQASRDKTLLLGIGAQDPKMVGEILQRAMENLGHPQLPKVTLVFFGTGQDRWSMEALLQAAHMRYSAEYLDGSTTAALAASGCEIS